MKNMFYKMNVPNEMWFVLGMLKIITEMHIKEANLILKQEHKMLHC